MNERLVNIQLNFEHQPKKKIKLYRLEGNKRPKLVIKKPQMLSFKFIGENHLLPRNQSENNIRVFPKHVKFPKSPVNIEKSIREFRQKDRLSIESLPLQEKGEDCRNIKTRSVLDVRDHKNCTDNKEKIIIITDNEFFKKKKQQRQLSVNLNIKNKTANNFFQNKELAPLEVKNFRNTTLSDFNLIKNEAGKIRKNSLACSNVKERTYSVKNFTFLKDVIRNKNVNSRDFPLGKKISDYTRSNVHIDNVLARINLQSKRHEINSNSNGFNELIHIQNLKHI